MAVPFDAKILLRKKGLRQDLLFATRTIKFKVPYHLKN